MATNQVVAATSTRRERVALRDLLIRATARAGRATPPDELQALAAAAPLAEVPAAADLHRVAGTVLRGLDGVNGIPEQVRNQLGALRQASTLHHLLVTGALGQIGRSFTDAGLAWLVMKGPVVAACLYPEPGDRAYADLDLLVDRRDFPEAVRLLEALGYQHKIHNWALAEEMLAGQITMTTGAIDVDLHWHLHYSTAERRPYAFDPDAMLERRRSVTASGLTVPTLDAVDTLLNLAFHAARSDGHRLIWLKDVERSLAVDQPDHDELVRRCRAARCGPPVGLILGRAAALLDADVPPEVVAALAPVTLRTSERLVATMSHPIGLHERPTAMRWFTRSARSSPFATVAELPARGVRTIDRRLRPPTPNETDDPVEKARYLAAVASSR